MDSLQLVDKSKKMIFRQTQAGKIWIQFLNLAEKKHIYYGV